MRAARLFPEPAAGEPYTILIMHLSKVQSSDSGTILCQCHETFLLASILLGEDLSLREYASTSWPSSTGLRGRRRTYHTILKFADHVLFKMVMYVLLRPRRPKRLPAKRCLR
jgi:hypothetical protein